MKKFLMMGLVVLLLFSMTACSQTNAPSGIGEPTDSEGNKLESLEDVMAAILKDVDMEIATDNIKVDDERFSWFFGIDPIEGSEGLASESMIGSIAHSICLLRVPENADAGKIATSIEEKADPRKWICVEAEKMIVKQKGDLILVIMSFEDIADEVSTNFDALYQ